MSLDKNLFTLLFTPHKDNPNVIDLVDPSENVHYRKQRIPGPEYKIEVYDPSSESLLATVLAPSAAAKSKNIELYNPTCVVELKYTGTLSFRWAFKWEEHEFEWKKEECFIIRKPDPPVNIAVTRESATRGVKSTSVQLLDYNLNRFDINDRKGLEIVMLTALLTFSDSNEATPANTTAGAATATPAIDTSARAQSALASAVSPSPSSGGAFGFGRGNANANAPPPPPKPAPKTGIDRISEMQAMKGEYNEIVVGEEGSVVDYAAYCNKLLQDDAMLFISVKSAEAEQVPKVLQVVEETKRIRYKAGLDEDEELHQYVLYDEQEKKKGPKIINLDDEKKNKYAPPKSLTVHLSKIDMPELQPKSATTDKSAGKSTGASSKKEDKKASKQSRPAPSVPAPSPVPATAPAPAQATPPPAKPKTSRLDFFKSSSSQAPSKPLTKPNFPGKLQRPQSAGNASKAEAATPQIPASQPDFRPPPQAPAVKPDYRPPQVPATKPDFRPPQNYPHSRPNHYDAPPSGRPVSYYGPPVSTNPGAVPGPVFPQPWSPGPTPPPPPHNAQNMYGSYVPPSGGGGGYGGGGWTPNPSYTPGPPPPPPPGFPSGNPAMAGGYYGGGPSVGSKPPSNLTTITQGATTVAHGLMGLFGGK